MILSSFAGMLLVRRSSFQFLKLVSTTFVFFVHKPYHCSLIFRTTYLQKTFCLCTIANQWHLTLIIMLRYVTVLLLSENRKSLNCLVWHFTLCIGSQPRRIRETQQVFERLPLFYFYELNRSNLNLVKWQNKYIFCDF